MADNAQNPNNQSFDQPSANKAGGNMRWLVTIILVVLIIVGGYYLVSKYGNLGSASQSSAEWQAVFLTNGQVYFGQVERATKDELVLNEIYYLQITQPLQRSSDQNVPVQNQNELALVKLGNELHGPTDEMRINREHVLFTEDLKDDSKVVEAIRNSKDQ